MPAFPSWAFTRCHHHSNWGSRHPIAAHYSLIVPERMKGRVGLVGWPIADGLLVTHQLQAGRAQDSESTPAKDRCYTAGPRNQPKSAFCEETAQGWVCANVKFGTNRLKRLNSTRLSGAIIPRLIFTSWKSWNWEFIHSCYFSSLYCRLRKPIGWNFKHPWILSNKQCQRDWFTCVPVHGIYVFSTNWIKLTTKCSVN